MLLGLVLLSFVTDLVRPPPVELLPGRVDVVLIIADDVGLEDILGTSTPNIDALAAQGVFFENAFANPVCSPSRRALHFGRWWPDARGEFCIRPDEHTPGDIPSLPRLLKSRGYATAVFGKWHVGSSPGGIPLMGYRFHGYDTWRAGIATNVSNPVCGGFGDYYRWRRVDDGVVTTSNLYADAAIRDEFLSWWTEIRLPRFGVVSFQLGHEPFHNPPRELLPHNTPAATTSRGKFKQMVQAMDTLVGQVLKAVGPEDIVVFVGDNGTPPPAAPPGQADRVKATTFERGIRVPLIIKAPPARRGAVSSALVHVADIFPTLAELTGQPMDTGQGMSLASVLVDPSRGAHQWIICGHHQRALRVNTHPTIDHCVRTERFKLRLLRHGGVESEQFYDLGVDPEELNPIPLTSPEYLAEIVRLRSIYEKAKQTF